MYQIALLLYIHIYLLPKLEFLPSSGVKYQEDTPLNSASNCQIYIHGYYQLNLQSQTMMLLTESVMRILILESYNLY